MRMILATTGTILVLASPALAQTGSFYGPSGQYQGSYNTFGGNTQYYGPSGQYQGQSSRFGNTTTIYGPSGQYQGSVIEPMQPIRPLRPMRRLDW